MKGPQFLTHSFGVGGQQGICVHIPQLPSRAGVNKVENVKNRRRPAHGLQVEEDHLLRLRAEHYVVYPKVTMADHTVWGLHGGIDFPLKVAKQIATEFLEQTNGCCQTIVCIGAT